MASNEFSFHLNCCAVIFLPEGITRAERKTAIINFNNAVVMSEMPLRNGNMFEVNIMFVWCYHVEKPIISQHFRLVKFENL